MEITGSVGEGGTNVTSDVIAVQRRLVSRGFRIGHADGICGRRTRAAILSFQGGFLARPDGRVDPGGKTWRHLVAAKAAPATEGGSLTRQIPRPDKSTLNNGLNAATNAFMMQMLGEPRDSYSADCQPVTNEHLRRNMYSGTAGPLKVTGLRPAVLSLQQVTDAIRDAQPEVYRALGTAGMLCCRWQRGSTKAISNHSWGTAIDIKLNNVLDQRGDGRVQFGLTLIAPIFNSFGWYWGAAFAVEDGMHFEASRALIDAWAGKLA